MTELFEFKSMDGRFKFVVKGEFLSKCDKPDTIETYELMTKYKLNQYLHNPKGPAIHRLKDDRMEYWINGNMVSKEEGEKIAHDFNFSNKLEELIKE